MRLNPSTSLLRSVDDLRGPAGRIEALLNLGRARCALRRRGVPSSPALRRNHAQQGGVSRHEDLAGLRAAGAALQFSRRRLERGRARQRTWRGGRCARRARLAGAGVPPAHALRRLLLRLQCGSAGLLRRPAGQRDRRPGASRQCRRDGSITTASSPAAASPSSLSAEPKISMDPRRRWKPWWPARLRRRSWCWSPAPTISSPVNWSRCSWPWAPGSKPTFCPR